MKEGYGEFIKRHRIASGYKNQRRLAEISGISQATISRIEKEIQKPEIRTLKTLAEYLDTTTYVELMVVCGYWDKEELIEDLDINSYSIPIKPKYPQQNGIDNTPESRKIYRKATKHTKINEEEFIKNMNLPVEDLLTQFNLTFNNEPLTEEESRGIIAYLQTLRQMQKKN